MGQSCSKEAGGSSVSALGADEQDGPFRKPIHILVARNIFEDGGYLQIARDLVNNGASSAFRHWALRVGDDVFELVKNKNLENRPQRKTWTNVVEQYWCTEVQGYTTYSGEQIRQLAETRIKSMRFYNTVTHNCQAFTLKLMEDIPKVDLPQPPSAHKNNSFRKVFSDLTDYVLARNETKHTSLQKWLDECCTWLKVTVALVVGAAIGTYRQGSIRALQWLYETLTQLPACAVKCVIEFLRSPLGISILAGLAAVVASGLVLWLAWEGCKNFYEWWNQHGRSITIAIRTQDVERGDLQMQVLTLTHQPKHPQLLNERPGDISESLQRPHRKVRVVEFQ